MKRKKIFPIFILLLLILTILYVLLAVKPLGKEYQFSPIWNINTDNPTVVSVPESKKKLYFHLNQSLGYFTEDGEISFYKTFPRKVSISDSYFSVYSPQANNTPFYNKEGVEVGKIRANGFPYFSDDLIFVFLPGGSSFSKCSDNGTVEWTFEGTVPITAFAAKKNFTAVGFANGYIKVFDTKTGTLQLTFAPGGSDFPVIFGLDISDDGQYIASVSGYEKQRFVLSKREDSQQKIVYHRSLNSNLPYRTLVHFCKDNNRVVYDYEGSASIYSIKEDKNTILPISASIKDIAESDDIIYLLSKKDKNFTVYIVENPDNLEGQFSFTADNAFIKTDNNNLYIGKDNSISCISVTKE